MDRKVCSFCNEEFPSSKEMGEHLIMCGTKTDKCPNCHKFIQRAVFAYHYENNCSNLDELGNDVRSSSEDKNTISTIQHNNATSSSSGSATVNGKNISIINVNLSSHSTSNTVTPERSGLEHRIVRCLHCSEECEIGEREQHEQKCLRNPNKAMNKQRADQVNHRNETVDNDIIPCEVCKEPIKFCDFQVHMNACVARHNARIQQQLQRTDTRPDTTVVRCQYCNKEYTAPLLENHKTNCRQNPVNRLSDEQYLSLYRPPDLPPTFN